MNEGRNWMRWLVSGLVVLLVVSAMLQWWLLQKIDLRLSFLDMSLRDDTEALSGELGAALETLRLAEGWTLSPCGVDRESGALQMEITVTLRTWREDTAAALLVTADGAAEFPLAQTASGVFAGTVEVPTGRSGPLTMALRTEESGTFVRETLLQAADLTELLPLRQNGMSVWGTELQEDGTATAKSWPEFGVADQAGEPVTVRDPEFRIGRNGETVLTCPAAWTEEDTDDIRYKVTREKWERYAGSREPWSVECAPGDILTSTFVCTDDTGLTYEFFIDGCTVRPDGLEQWTPAKGVYPILTWE